MITTNYSCRNSATEVDKAIFDVVRTCRDGSGEPGDLAELRAAPHALGFNRPGVAGCGAWSAAPPGGLAEGTPVRDGQ
jgi:hypothetical protein